MLYPKSEHMRGAPTSRVGEDRKQQPRPQQTHVSTHVHTKQTPVWSVFLPMFETPCSHNTLSRTSVFLSIPHAGNGCSVRKDGVNAVRGAVHARPCWRTHGPLDLPAGSRRGYSRTESIQCSLSGAAVGLGHAAEGFHVTGCGASSRARLILPPCLLRAWGLHQVWHPPPVHPLLQGNAVGTGLSFVSGARGAANEELSVAHPRASSTF